MKKFTSLLINFFILTSFTAYGDEVSILEPTALMKHETKWLVQALEQAHYNKVRIQDLNASKFLNAYLKKLDPQKIYFTNSEVESFHKNISPTIITYFKQGNLFPAFEIFRKYQSNAVNRLDSALEMISKFSLLESNETYLHDRTKAVWSANKEKLDLLWDKLIRHGVLNELVNTVDSNNSNPNQGILNDLVTDARKVLNERYTRWRKNILEFESEDVQEIYLSSLTQCFDPHTTFMNLKEKEKFDQAMNNEFVGIGAVLTDVDGFCTIKELLPGGPAEACRELEPEDIIIKVAQAEGPFVDVVDMKLSKIVDLIKGPKDTIVRMEIKPIKSPTTTKIISIVRDKIKLTDKLANASIHMVEHENKNHKFGGIELPSFYGSAGKGPKATDDVEELINALKKENIEGLILDLRRNGGGYLSEAIDLAGLFISRGPVVQVKNTDGKIRKKFDFDPKLVWNMPLIILVSRQSASASEIVTGALKNHKRAIVVGDKSTHGKGTVQSLLQMNLPFNFMQSSKKGSAAKITIQKYYLPSGESTQIYGVKSDIVLPSVNEFLPIGESDLDNALEWDSIPPVNHRRTENEFVYDIDNVEEIQKRSLERQKMAPEFNYIHQNIEIFKDRKNKKDAILDLAVRLQEKIKDTNSTDQLNELYDSFDELSFPKKEIKLRIVEDQLAKSRIARGENDLEINSSIEKEYAKPDSLDIRLHESLRIMSDWLSIREKSQISGTTLSETKEI